jgi:hypothetical protein
MSKGVLQIANVTGDGVDYNDREISTETGQTLSVYLNSTRIDLARADMNNVAADAVRSKVADELQELEDQLSSVTAESGANAAALPKKKDLLIGLTKPYTADIATVSSTNTILLKSFQWFDGTDLVQHQEETITIGPKYAGQVVYVGLNESGIGEISTSDYDIYLALCNIYVNADGDLTASELSVRPFLADSSTFGRDHPIMVVNFAAQVTSSDAAKGLSCQSFDLIKEGINYAGNSQRPDRKLFPAMSSINFKYYYPNYDHDGETAQPNIQPYYYNTTTSAKTLLDSSNGTSKFVVFRLVLIETGQILLLLQQVSDESQLFTSVQEAELGLKDLNWNLSQLSSRAIYLDQFIVCSADLTICQMANVAEVSNSQNITINQTIYGVLSDFNDVPNTVEEFSALFSGLTPEVGGWIFADSGQVTLPNNGTINRGLYMYRIKSILNGNIQYDSWDMASSGNALSSAYFTSRLSAPYIAVATGSLGIGSTFSGQIEVAAKNPGDDYSEYTLSDSTKWPLIDSNGSLAMATSEWTSGSTFTANMLCAATEKVMSRNSQISAVDSAAVTLDNQIKHYTIRVTHMNSSAKLPVAITVPAGIPDDAVITFELLIDCSDSSYGSLVTGVEFTVNGSAITPYWIDNSDGVFQESSAPYKLIALRRSLRYNSTAALPGYEPQWIANIEAEYDTTA